VAVVVPVAGLTARYTGPDDEDCPDDAEAAEVVEVSDMVFSWW
jgi:hypothetical protein